MIYSRKAREELKKESGATQREQEGAADAILEGSEGKPRVRAVPQAWSKIFQLHTGVQKTGCRNRQFHSPPPNEIHTRSQVVAIQI